MPKGIRESENTRGDNLKPRPSKSLGSRQQATRRRAQEKKAAKGLELPHRAAFRGNQDNNALENSGLVQRSDDIRNMLNAKRAEASKSMQVEIITSKKSTISTCYST